MKNYLQTFVKDIKDKDILELLKEIEAVRKFAIAPYIKGSMLVHYLTDLIKRGPITKESIDAKPFSGSMLLRQKIKKLHDTEIYWLCNEIAALKRSGVELNEGKTLYVFLSQFLKEPKTKKKKKPPEL